MCHPNSADRLKKAKSKSTHEDFK